MSTVATTAALPARLLSRRAQAALLSCAGLFLTTALVDLIGHPHTLHGLTRTIDYVFTALLIPIALAVLWLLSELHLVNQGRDGRLGRAGLGLAGLGLIGFIAAGIATIATASTDTQGPLYPLSMMCSLAGFALLATGWDRARVVPRWTGPLLAIAWVIGGPLVIFSGAELIFAAVLVMIALAPSRGQ